MKRLFLATVSALFVLSPLNSHSQIPYTEDFDGVTTWTLNTSLGGEGGSPNLWYISCNEEGVGAGLCGSGCTTGDQTLHMGWPTADLGATYLEGLAGALTTHRRAESADISTLGASGMTLSFDFIGWGGNALDYTELVYSIDGGTSWIVLDPDLQTNCCGDVPCTGLLQGLWVTNTYPLPVSCEGIPDLRIGFNWHNEDDGVATDPSFAVDNISITGTVTAGPPVADFNINDTTICIGSSLTFEDESTTMDVISDWNWTFDGGSPASETGAGPHTVVYNTAGSHTQTLEVIDGIGSDTYSITVTVVDSNFAGGDTSHGFCLGDPSADLFLDLPGADVGGSWSPAMTSGTGVFDPADDPSGTYTYTVDNGTCPAASADVVVSIFLPPSAGMDGTHDFCENDAAADLFSDLGSADVGGTWSPAMDSGSGVFDPSVDAAGDYTYTVSGSGGCPDSSATITVTITEFNSAGEDSTVDICRDQASINLFTVLGGDYDAGGTWSDDDATGELTGSVFDYSMMPLGPYNFTYTQTNTAPCVDDAATVTINIIDCLGIGDESIEVLVVKPNPVQEIIDLSYSNLTIEEMKLYTLSGQLIRSTNDHKMNVEDLASGSYVLIVKTDKQLFRSKIVK